MVLIAPAARPICDPTPPTPRLFAVVVENRSDPGEYRGVRGVSSGESGVAVTSLDRSRRRAEEPVESRLQAHRVGALLQAARERDVRPVETL